MPGVDFERGERAVRQLLDALGIDPHASALERTPQRVVELYAELFAGVGRDPVALLSDAVPVGEETGDLVMVRDLELLSVCEHHLLPFRGVAHIAYAPAKRVAGLSSLAKVLHTIAARPQVQERLGEHVASALESGLEPRGVLVVLQATHGCLSDRGVRESNATVTTVASRGSLNEPSALANALRLLGIDAGRSAE